jgi:hypothetical protein
VLRGVQPKGYGLYIGLLVLSIFGCAYMAGDSLFKLFTPRAVDLRDSRLVALQFVGDLMTAIGFTVTGLSLFYLYTKGKLVLHKNMVGTFSLFIFMCGGLSVINVIALWKAYYWFEGIFKIATGIVSIYTMLQLPALIRTVLHQKGYLELTADLEKSRLELHETKNAMQKLILKLNDMAGDANNSE